MSSNTISPETLKTEYVLPEKCIFSLNPNGFLAAEIDGKEYKRVILTRSLPLTLPNEYICISDIEKNELGIIEKIADFSQEQQKLINSELSQRYYCPVIGKIESIKEKMGHFYFETVIDGKDKSFTVRDLTRNLRFSNDGADE